MTTKATFKGITITATYTGSKPAPWNGDANWNHHKIRVYYKGRRLEFDFWASLAKPEVRSPREVLDAFECFLSDAISGNQDFEEFCSEFEYDTDSRKAEKTWKACKSSYSKFKRVFGDSFDIYKLANQVQERED